jgi:hypothetical protein
LHPQLFDLSRPSEETVVWRQQCVQQADFKNITVELKLKRRQAISKNTFRQRQHFLSFPSQLN